MGSGGAEGNGATPSPADLPDPGIEPGSPALQADSLPLSYQGRPFHFHPFGARCPVRCVSRATSPVNLWRAWCVGGAAGCWEQREIKGKALCP